MGTVIQTIDLTLDPDELTARIEAAKRILDAGDGVVIFRGFPLAGSEDVIEASFAAFSRRFGEVRGHGVTQRPIWRVSPRAKLDHEPTFSETASEAPLHTDNSWVREPERYFALLVLRPARDGGDSIAFPIAPHLQRIARTPEGKAILRVLMEEEFPFATPAVFHDHRSHEEQVAAVVTAPVIGGASGFRFRRDVIDAGFHLRPDLVTSEKLGVLDAFEKTLHQAMKECAPVHLKSGEILIANNQAVLHARSNFTDPDRLLLRARMAVVKGKSEAPSGRPPRRSVRESAARPAVSRIGLRQTLRLKRLAP